MTRTFFLALLIILLLFAGLVTLRPALLALAIPIILYLLAGFLYSPEKVNLKADRVISAERVKTGDEVTITLTVSNHGKALEDVLLVDQIPDGLEVTDGSSRHLGSIQAGGSVTLSYTLKGKRGYYGLKKIHATIGGGFGLSSLEVDLPTEGQLYILPPVLRLRRVAIQPRRTRIFSGVIPARQGGSGVEFYDLREYQTGDSPRRINWRATARHPQQVFSNEFEQERAADVGIILDGRKRTNDFGDRSIFENSVLATAALVDTFLNAGNRVGMLFYGKQITWTMPGYGKLQGERILQELSHFEPGDSQTFSEIYVPRHLFPTRSQLVLISPLIAEDYDMLVTIRLSGFNLLVISPDPVSFESSGMVESRTTMLAKRIVHLQREVLLRRLRGAGIHVVDWDTSQPFEQIARLALERRMVFPRGVHR